VSRAELNEFLDAVTDLLAIPSTADNPAALTAALDFVVDFAGPGFTVERFESGGKPSALLYRGTRRPSFRVVLNGHLDVVPATDGQFRPRRDGARLYARGAQDMKVSALALAAVFRELAPDLPYPVGLQLVADEELGGHDGTRHQLLNDVTTSFAIIGESSGLDVVTESKGIVAVTLDASGRTAHSAYQWLGDNALVSLHATVAAVLERYPVAEQEEWRTIVSLVRVETPNTARNQIPDTARAWLDVRYPHADDAFTGRSAEQIAGYLQSMCAPGVTAIVERLDAPHYVDPAHPDVRALAAAAREQGVGGQYLRKHGAGDGRFYGARGIPAVAFGIGGGGQHGPEEYGDMSTIEPYLAALRSFLRGLAELVPFTSP
jgi:succinyl-diaminopimelate desuccinylase